MKHSIDFFRDEIRNGFYIPTAIKQSWANALDILAEIDRICKKHDIKYFADWGSFLGAVRHGGFIPWDDDLDICMKRDDYDRFRAIADAELPPEYCIHDFERHDDHWLFLSRVVNSSRISFDEAFLNDHYNFPWLTGVDIFVKDYLYKDSAKEKERCDEIMFILAIAEGVINGDADPSTFSSNLDKLEKKYSIKFSNRQIGRNLAVALYALAQQQMARAPKEEADRICQIFPWGLKGNPGEPCERYENSEYLPFEDTLIPVPAFYNQALSAHYGDYNVIKKGVAGHDYPSFEGQRKNLEAATGAQLPRFKFDASLLTIERNITSNSSGRRRILFLPIGPREWSGFEATYNKENSDPDTEVLVVPLPVMPKNCVGEITMSDAEIAAADRLEEYPDDLPLMSWTEYDLEQHRPDTIYIQSPYDAENPYLTVPPYFYAENLIFYTKDLVYIPIGPVADFTESDIPDLNIMDFYVTMPAVVLADRILLHSETLKAHYVNKLTDFTGDDSTRSIWERRISVISDLYIPTTQSSRISLAKELSVPDENSVITGAAAHKRLLYCISSYELYEHPDVFSDAVASRLEILKNTSDRLKVSVCLYPPIVTTAEQSIQSENTNSELDNFRQIVRNAAATTDFPVDSFDIASADEFVSGFDAYYGSSSPLVPIFVAQKKPVMIANYELDLF